MTYNRLSRNGYIRMGRQGYNASNYAKDTDEYIDRLLEPKTRRKTPTRLNSESCTLKRGKPLCSQYNGLTNPPKLNISKDTLDKIRKQ